jgi:hypothetical protein
MASAAPTENKELVYIGPAKRGRQTTYTQYMADLICARIANGETLSSICLEDDMPGRRTVTDWLMTRDDFAAQYARARAAQVDFEADEIRDIADESGGDAYIVMTPNGPVAKIDGEAIQRAKLRIETRQWRAERLNRRVYGNSVKHEHELTVHAPTTARQIPPGIGWIAEQLSSGDTDTRSEPGDSGVGEE